MKRKIKALWAKRPYRKLNLEESLKEAITSLPRITNETVAEHREAVIGGARKYIYPLKHSVQKIVSRSFLIFAVLVLAFLVYCLLAIYRFNNTSTFLYRITQVIPFPVAKAGPDFVAYENYLFELRHYIHYYQTQQKVDFSTQSGQQQLAAFRKVALKMVVDQAYIKQLAKEHSIKVSDQELDRQVSSLRDQNRLGSSDKVFEDVLREFWGWSVGDFRRELKAQMLAQKVVSALDKDTHNRANNVLNELRKGADFAALAQKSDDLSTKDKKGDYGYSITRNDRDLPPQVVAELFKYQPGQISNIVETALGLEILKVNEADGSSVRASHIFFAFKNVNAYIDPLKEKHKPRNFISP